MKTILSAAALLATGASASSVYIEFEFFEATYEANAVDVWSFEYSPVFAYDSHNEQIDLCERVWMTNDADYVSGAVGDDVSVLCCTASDREAMADGCSLVFDSHGWSDDGLPDACDSLTDYECAGVDTEAVAEYEAAYDACDFSYNCAEQVMFEVLIQDTTPPVIGCATTSYGACQWSDDVEACTYFDVEELSAFDYVDCDVDISYSITYGGTVSSCSSNESGNSCSGGTEVDDIDVDSVGVYCVQYDAWDDAGNEATSETYVVVVEDTTDPNLYFETEAVTIECAVESCVPDAGASSDNVPCDDEPEVVWDDSDVDLNSVGVWDIVYSTDDGYNGVSSTFTVTIEDTTPPTITCPNDYVYEYLDTYSEGSATAADTCSDITQSDDQYDAYPVEGGILSEIGTYYATYDVVDAAGLTASCQQEVVVQDTTPPECEFVGDEYVTVEACTGEYTELGVECTDHYDDDLSPWCDGDCGAVDEWTVGTYVITYGVTDVNGNSATTLTRHITVEDTTDPVLTNIGADSLIMEASNPDGRLYTIGAKCTDTCLAITSQGKIPSDALSWSPDDEDLDQYIEFDVSSIAYSQHSEYTEDWEAGLSWVFCTNSGGCVTVSDDLADMVEDEQQYYCGSDSTASELTAQNAMDDVPDGGDKLIGGYLQELAGACGLYEITYTCVDQVGNTATSTQHVYTRDTIDPTIFTGDYSLFESATVDSTGGALLGVMGVAFVVGVVATKTRRVDYIPI